MALKSGSEEPQLGHFFPPTNTKHFMQVHDLEMVVS
eukprot:CAMPEP_0182458832 /NCGR_PEP_ID=MMETSP1319-20130603/4078_1 /TAXON_ID=172717 /ORGANISM="Bolidomonas pacifica, Strain RCC208" /LENGTH=35 /DNA_ID= /DNA_START= /DNA_END= /DNA_ORIENTATION=